MQELWNTLWDSTLMEIVTLVTSWKAFLTGFLESKYQFVLQIANTIFFLSGAKSQNCIGSLINFIRNLNLGFENFANTLG